MSINNINSSTPSSNIQEAIAYRQATLATVQHNGLALADASEELRNDREIVLAAVQQNGLALEFASAILRGDSDIVLAAMQQNIRAFSFATQELRNDPEFTDAAMQLDGWELEFTSRERRLEYFLTLGMQETLRLAANQERPTTQQRAPQTSAQNTDDLMRQMLHILVLTSMVQASGGDSIQTRTGSAPQPFSEGQRNDQENARDLTLRVIVTSLVESGNQTLRATVGIVEGIRDQYLVPERREIVTTLEGHSSSQTPMSPIARFKAAVTDQALKELNLEAFDDSLQPRLTQWFARLLMTQTFQKPESASILANQVYSILAYAQKNDEFKTTLQEELENAQMSCSDSSLIIYNRLSTAKKLMEVFAEPQEKIIKLCLGLYKLSLLEVKAFEQYSKNGGDQISIALGLQAKLRDALSLPIDFDDVQFGTAGLGLTDDLISSTQNYVMESLKDLSGFIQYLSDLEPWRNYLLKNEEVQAKHQKISDEFSEQLDELMDKADTMPDAEYLAAMNKNAQDRELALSEYLQKPTRQMVDSVKLDNAVDESAAAASSSQ